MVRPKVQLERLNGKLTKDHFYLQNRATICKKVWEMSILTGAQLLFLTFSDSGIPSLFLGHNTDLMQILTRFSEIAFHDREKRRLDNLCTLKANYQKEDYKIDVDRLYTGWKIKRLEALYEKLRHQKERMSRLNQQKRLWENPKKINSIKKLKEMEGNLLKSLKAVRMRKDELNAQKILSSQDPEHDRFEDFVSVLFGRDDHLLQDYANMFPTRSEAELGNMQK
ncbi:hypothetical protein Ancab_028974 [Ancistrocladus abbreviatus]